MDIKAINQGLTIAGNAIKTLVAVKESMPPGKERTAAEKLLKEAGERLKEAEARIGHELGFPVCKRCWPPEIMLQTEDGDFVCPGCRQVIPPGAAAELTDSDDLATW